MVLVPFKMLHRQSLRVKVKFNVFNMKKEYQGHRLQNRRTIKQKIGAGAVWEELAPG